MGDSDNFSFKNPLPALDGAELFLVWKDSRSLRVSFEEIFNYTTGNFPGSRFKITPEGGYAIALYNKTGSVSVKGTPVTAISTFDEAVELLSAAALDGIGVVYNSGVADGDLVWVVVSGIAEYLLEDGTGSTSGNWIVPSQTVAGRADATALAPPGEGVVEHQFHFSEIGHSIQTVVSGTDVLCKAVIHFN